MQAAIVRDLPPAYIGRLCRQFLQVGNARYIGQLSMGPTASWPTQSKFWVDCGVWPHTRPALYTHARPWLIVYAAEDGQVELSAAEWRHWRARRRRRPEIYLLFFAAVNHRTDSRRSWRANPFSRVSAMDSLRIVLLVRFDCASAYNTYIR